MSRRSPTLLVIDDDDDIREVIKVIFEDRGFEVDTLADGIDAVELTKSYDVILLDLNMPVFDGERLADYWSLTAPELLQRVVFLSGYSRFARGRPLTAATVRKPFEAEELVRVVDDCVARSGLRDTDCGLD